MNHSSLTSDVVSLIVLVGGVLVIVVSLAFALLQMLQGYM